MLSRFALAAVLAVAAPAIALAEDQIDRKGGAREQGVVTATSKKDVTLRANGVDRSIPANEIIRISYDDEPGDMRSIRRDLADNNYRSALEDLKKIDPASIEREVIRQEVEFYRAYCMSKTAMNEGGDKAAAEAALKDFASKYNNSYHFYQAAELAGDLAASAGKYADAAKYYGAVASVEWNDMRLRGNIALARMLAAQDKHAEALEKFEAVVNDSATSADIAPIKQQAVVGKAMSMAETGKAKEAIAMLEGVIASNDPKNVPLMARAYNAQGVAHLKEGNKKAAVLSFLFTHLLYFQEPDAHAEALYYLSKLFQEVNKPERAIEVSNTLKQRYAGSVWDSKK